MLPLEYFRQETVSRAPAKKLITREQLENDIEEFLAKGGKIKIAPPSAWQVHNGSRVSITINPEKQDLLNTKPPQPRKPKVGVSGHEGIQKVGNKWRAVVGRHFVGEYASMESAIAERGAFIKSLKKAPAHNPCGTGTGMKQPTHASVE